MKLPDEESWDKLHKLRPVLQFILKRFHTIPKEENLSVDEQMCPTKTDIMCANTNQTSQKNTAVSCSFCMAHLALFTTLKFALGKNPKFLMKKIMVHHQISSSGWLALSAFYEPQIVLRQLLYFASSVCMLEIERYIRSRHYSRQ